MWEHLKPDTRRIAEETLTERQLYVLRANFNGATHADIALALGITRATVAGHLAAAELRLSRALRDARKEPAA